MKARTSLEGRVAIVTGGARGLGFAIAEVLGDAGARLVITDLDEGALTEAEGRLAGAGMEVVSVAGNVSVAEDCQAMIAAATGRFGRLDILVNNAGGSAYTPSLPEEITEADFVKVMDWNARGTFLCIQGAIPALKANGGSIVNMTSMSGRTGWTMFSPQYSAAKAAIIGLTRNYSAHLGKYGIRVNAIAPGFIEGGDRARAMWDARDNTQVLRDISLGRRGENVELANVALFLASDLSSYVTGCVIDVNGGYLSV